MDAIRDEVAAALAGRGRWASSTIPASELVGVPGDVAFVVATSGSTGTPKRVLLTADAVQAGAAATAERIGTGVWALALPTDYVAGLMVVARAVCGDTPVVDVGSDLAGLGRALALGPTHVSVVPTQLMRALASPELREQLVSCRTVLLGGAAASPGLLAQARAAGIPVVTTYGMAETCGGCVYDGVPLAGVSVHIGSDSRIELTGPMMFSGYLGEPDLTAETLRSPRSAAGEQSSDEDGLGSAVLLHRVEDLPLRTVRTQDRGRWIDGHLEVLGRIDDVVISGGTNVDLAELTGIAEEHWGDAVAFGVPDPEWGTRVVLAVTTEVTLAAVRERLRGRLEPAALPRGLVHADSLPRTDRGKIDRQALAALWHDAADRELH